MIRILFILCFGLNFLFSQQTEYVDFKSAKVAVYFEDLKTHEISGTVIYSFEVLKDVLRDGRVLISAGHKINPPELLFAKINDRKDKSRLALIDLQKEKLEVLKKKMAAAKAQEEKEPEAIKEACTFDDFTKIDFRTGTITAAEKIKKAKKLLKLTIDLGFETRTVVSGIALHYEPEAIIGQQVTLVANLAPREMMGIESQGMVLMAENKEGKLIFVGPQELAINGGAIR